MNPKEINKPIPNSDSALFVPGYVEGVTVTVPGQPPSPINPGNVLGQGSAEELQLILNNAGYPCNIVMAHPLNYKKGGADPSQLAPWFKFNYVDANGQPYVFINAGVLAQNWAHPDGRIHFPANVALRYAIAEIESAVEELKTSQNW